MYTLVYNIVVYSQDKWWRQHHLSVLSVALTADIAQCCTGEGQRSSVRKPSDCLWVPVAYNLVTRHFDISLGQCNYRLCFLYIIIYIKIKKIEINQKPRTKSNRTSYFPECLEVAVLSYVTFRVNLIVTVTCKHTDSIDSSIIITHEDKFLPLFN